MGVKIFRDDSWRRIKGGDISRMDILPGMTAAYREAIWDCWSSLQAEKQKKEKTRG